MCISSSEDEELYANARPTIAAPQYLTNAQPPAIPTLQCATGNETVSVRASQYSDSFSGDVIKARNGHNNFSLNLAIIY